jgi:hypothetical protein
MKRIDNPINAVCDLIAILLEQGDARPRCLELGLETVAFELEGARTRFEALQAIGEAGDRFVGPDRSALRLISFPLSHGLAELGFRLPALPSSPMSRQPHATIGRPRLRRNKRDRPIFAPGLRRVVVPQSRIGGRH